MDSDEDCVGGQRSLAESFAGTSPDEKEPVKHERDDDEDPYNGGDASLWPTEELDPEVPLDHEQVPDLQAYFSMFPDVTQEEIISMCRTYATMLWRRLSVHRKLRHLGRTKRARKELDFK